MNAVNTKEPIFLIIFDISILVISLWTTLLVRLQGAPDIDKWNIHIYPFLFIFAVWIIVFYISGLYDRHTSILKNKISGILINSHLTASFISVLFFYIFPFFNITPKVVLFIFILISFALFYASRVYVYPRLSLSKKYSALLIGGGAESDQVFEEVNADKFYRFNFVQKIDPTFYLDKDYDFIKNHLDDLIIKNGVSIVVVDHENKSSEYITPVLYSHLFNKINFLDLNQVYEEIFFKVPVYMINHGWFIKYITTRNKRLYDYLKRSIDIAVSFVGGLVSLVFYPFVILAIKLEDPKGSVFISQERVGKYGKTIKIYKFRTMTNNENGVWLNETSNKVTKVGGFLRKSSIDEFPQFWSIFKGDLSLIGPRPDMLGLEARLSKEIPYYSVRYLVKPGLSGWAQTKQDVIPQNIEQNKDRLAYDLYYIKNRSILMDVNVIFKTIKALATRGGR